SRGGSRGLALEVARARQAPRTADAAPRLDVLAVRRAALPDGERRALRRRRRDLVRRLRQVEPAPAGPTCRRAGAGGREHLHGGDALARRTEPAGVRRPRRRGVRRLLRAALARRPDREPVGALLADAEPARAARPLARGSPRAAAPDRRPG